MQISEEDLKQLSSEHNINLTPEHIESLLDPQIGVFYGVEVATVEHIIRHSQLEVFKKNDQVFAEGLVAEQLPAYVILSGSFWQYHTTPDGKGKSRISVDEVGVILADVELYVRGVDPLLYKRLSGGCSLSIALCAADAVVLKVFPATTLFDNASFALSKNLLKALSLKLLRRNSRLEDDTLLKQTKIVRHLAHMVKSREVRDNLDVIPRHKTLHDDLMYQLVNLETDFTELPNTYAASKQLMSNIKSNLLLNNVNWKDGTVGFSPNAYRALCSETPEVLLKIPVGAKKHRSKANTQK